MKKKFLICFIAIMLLSVSACAKNESTEEKDNAVETTVEKTVAETPTTEEQETEETVTETMESKKTADASPQEERQNLKKDDTDNSIESVQTEPDSSMSTEEKTEDDTTENTESDAIESMDEDSYVGEYNSYDTDEPNLEIQKNWDGSYLVQIGMFRLAQLDDCEGKWTEQGLEFSTDEYGKDFSGIITLEDDIATVTFTSEGWKEFADDLNVFKYYKTADVPNIYVPDY